MKQSTHQGQIAAPIGLAMTSIWGLAVTWWVRYYCRALRARNDEYMGAPNDAERTI